MKNPGLPKKKRLLKWWEKPHLFVYQAGTFPVFPFRSWGFPKSFVPANQSIGPLEQWMKIIYQYRMNGKSQSESLLKWMVHIGWFYLMVGLFHGKSQSEMD